MTIADKIKAHAERLSAGINDPARRRALRDRLALDEMSMQLSSLEGRLSGGVPVDVALDDVRRSVQRWEDSHEAGKATLAADRRAQARRVA